MVEVIKCIGKIINVCADPVWCIFFVCATHSTVELGKFQHQRLLTLGCCGQDLCICNLFATLLILVQNRLHTNDRVKDVWTCVTLERSKAVNIENIILRCLVGKISILDRRKCNDLGCLSRLVLFHGLVIHDLFVHLFIDLRNQSLQTHNAAFSCLKWLSVLAVHGTKTDELEFCRIRYDTGLSCTAEYLDKV